MPKLKNRKRTEKRFKITGSGKIIKRTAGQGHFNSRATGTKTAGKRKGKTLTKREANIVRKQLPNA